VTFFLGHSVYSAFSDSSTPDCLQSCLTTISDWSDHWQLKLSPTKCSVLHVCPARRRKESNSFVYHIGNTTLPSVDSITDLGVTYDTKLMFRPHIDKVVLKAALRAKLILKCFCSRDPSLSRAFCTFIRPILEYCSTSWNLFYKCDISKIESVQRRFTRRLNGLKNLSYSCRLARLNLDSLYCRHVKSDLTMCYKIISNLICIDIHPPFNFMLSSTSQTRGNSMKLKKNHVVPARDGHFFVNHIINI